MSTSQLTRTTVAGALVACAFLSLASILLMPDFGGTVVERLEAVAQAGPTAAVSAFGFTLAQLPFAVGAAGVAHLLRRRTPRLAPAAGVLLVLGAFGHAVYGGVSLTMLDMAQDTPHHAVHADILAAGERSAAIVPFLLMGVGGTVLGLALLAVALWRASLGPRWLPVAVIAFVVLEFGGTAVSMWAGYAAVTLFFLVLLTLAGIVHRSSPAHWETAAEASARADDDAARGLVVQPSGVGVHDDGGHEEAQEQRPQG